MIQSFFKFEPPHRQLHRCVLSYIGYSASDGFVIRFWSRRALLLIPGSRITDYSHAYREFGPWFAGTFFFLCRPLQIWCIFIIQRFLEVAH